MQYIDFYNKNIGRTARLYTWVSVVWNVCYNEAGAIQIEFAPDTDVSNYIDVGYFCKYSESTNFAVITSIEFSDESIIAYCYDVLRLISDRCKTTTTEAGSAEQAIIDIVSEHFSNYPIIGTSSASGLSATFSHSVSAGAVYDIAVKIAQESDIGMKMELVNNKFVLRCFKPGKNNNAIFAKKYGNIAEIKYRKSELNYKNVCIVTGNGINGETVTVTVGDTSKTGSSRKELHLTSKEKMSNDMTRAEFEKVLSRVGMEALAEHQVIKSLDCTLYGNDYELGDIVTIILPEFSDTLEMRVNNVCITNQDNITTRTVTVGTVF